MKQKLLFLLTALMLLTTGNAWGEEANLSPTADTYFDWSNAETSYGSATTLYCGVWQEMWGADTPGLKGTTSNIAVFKFDVSAYKGKMTGATFKVTATNPSTNTNTRSIYLGYFESTSWTESSTANNSGMNTRSKTVLNIHPFSLSQSIAKGQTKEVSFSSDAFLNYLNDDEDGIVSLIVYGVGQQCSVNSKEAASGKPQLTLTYTNETLYDYSIKAVSGGTIIKDFISGKDADGAEFSTYLPKVIYYGGNYYELDDDDVTGYYAQYEIDGADANKEINYTLKSEIKAFFECENMANSHNWYNTLSNSQVASNGSAVTIYSNNDAHTNSVIGEGIYDISVSSCSTWADNYNDSFKLQYSTDNTNWIDIKTLNFAKNVGSVQTAENVVMPGGYLRLLDVSGHTPRHYVDYILVKKVGDYPNEIVGKQDYTTNYYSAWNTTPIWIKAGETAYYKFKNYNKGGNLYENWYLFGATEASENVVIFGPNHSNTATHGSYTSQPTFTMADLNGATIELTTTLTDDGDGTYTLTTTGVTTKADGTTKLSPNLVYTQTHLTASKLKLYVSVEKSWLELLSQEVQVTLGTNGYATFASPNALNLANLPTGLTAYKAAVEGTTVTFTGVTKAVQANTGLLFKGAASTTYSIPVASSGSDISATNAFLVNTNGIDKESGYTYYGLLKNTLTFATFDPTSVTIPSNKAYLKVANNPSARLVVRFDEEDPTAINAVEAAKAEAGTLKDGKYFEGGKIVIVKNGVKYSTNGQILK